MGELARTLSFEDPARWLLISIVAVSLLVAFSPPLFVRAEKPAYYVDVTKVNGVPLPLPPGTVFAGPIHLEGTASGMKFAGQLSSYQVQVDWGDGTVDVDSTVNFVQSWENFTGTWSSNPDHTYSLTGNVTITVKLYHGQPPGAESGDASFSVTIAVVARQITVTASPAGALGGGFLVTYTKDGSLHVDEPHTTPWTERVDDGSTVTVSSPESPLGVGDTRYVFQAYSPASTVAIDADKTITLLYKTQHKVTFAQTGVGADFTGTVLVVDGVNYDATALPASFWWDEGSSHSFAFQSPLTAAGTGKRYVWTSTSGLSTLQSGFLTVAAPGSITGSYKTQYQATFTQTGLDETATGTVVTIGGLAKTMGELPFTDWFDEGTAYLYSSIVSSNVPGKRFTLESVTGPGSTIKGSGTVTGVYKTQYYLTVDEGGHGTATGEGWYDAGSTASFSISPLTVPGGTGTRYVFTGWVGSGLGSYTGLEASHIVTMNNPVAETAGWKTQHYLTMSTNFGTVSPGSGWHDAGSTLSISAAAPSEVDGERYVWLGWAGTGYGSYSGTANPASITMNGPITETAAWRRWLRLIISSAYDSPNPAVGEHWYPAGASLTASVTSPWPGGEGTRYACTGWTGTGSAPASGTEPMVNFSINEPSSIAWNWTVQHYLVVNTSPDAVLALNASAVSGQGWYDAGTYAVVDAVQEVEEAPGQSRYDFRSWTGVTAAGLGNRAWVLMDGPKSATANYRLQYYLAVSSGQGLPTPLSGWYDAGASITASVTSPADDNGAGTRYRATGWTGTGSIPASGAGTNVAFTLDAPSSITWNWVAQFYLTVESPYGTPGGEGWYDEGATAYATFETGGVVQEEKLYVFVNWSGDASGTGLTSDPIVMDSPKTAIGNWMLQYYIFTLDKSPRRGVMLVDETAYSVFPVTQQWLPGSSHSVAVPELEAGVEGARYRFSEWSDGSNLTGRTLAVYAPGGLTAYYRTDYYLSVLSEYGDPYGEGWYPEGSEASFGVTSPVDHGNRTLRLFLRWSGDVGLSTPQGTIVLTKPSAVLASWETQYQLTITAKGVAEPFIATVTISPGFSATRSLSYTSPVQEWLGEGIPVSLTTSTPNRIGHGEWAVFKEWSGDAQGRSRAVSLTMIGPRTVDAWFFKVNPVAESIPYSLLAGLIAMVSAYMVRRRRRRDAGRKTASVTLGLLVSAVALTVAALVSGYIAVGYSIPVNELLDFTNWAVLFLAGEAVVFLPLTMAVTARAEQSRRAEADLDA